jgi:Tol biopolymer transport system component
MTLERGSRLGPYEISGPIGAGGMGEVFRARDTKLGRDVAIKVLPAAFAQDAERVARFRREAHLLASLNHPNIAAIHGLEEADGVVALALELVEGEDLAERLKRGAIPIDEATSIATRVAEALEEAHDKGIVHRDLKPANVKLTPDGKVKVLDFGLAKAWTGDGPGAASGADVSQSPTLAHTGTAAGIILGTAAYMSPEQARGKAVDRRTDIWAFGVVLYEMLTGRRLFEGETVTDVLAAVVRQEIGWHALPAATPASVRRLLVRCLDRDPRQRLRDIGEARVALGAPEAAHAGVPDVSLGARTRSARFWPAVAIGCLLAGIGAGALLASRWPSSSSRPTDRPARTVALAAPGRGLDDSQAVSPDGRFVAYTASGVLYIRNLGELEAREVKDSRGARGPFWSPRSDAVAYATETSLFKVSIEGNKPVELCRVAGGAFTGGTWSAEKGIVFTLARANWNGDVLRVPEAGGEPEVFTRADPARRERRLAQPHFLPDGRTLLYSVVTLDSNEGEVAIDRDGVRTLAGLGDGSLQPAWSPTGHVVFTRGTKTQQALWALPFSLARMAPAGEAFRIAANGSAASASADGTLVYGQRHPDPEQLAWVDRAGRVLGALGEPMRSSLTVPSVSGDGRRVAATADGQVVVWDAERGMATPLVGESGVFGPEWVPGGQELVYTRQAGGLSIRRADGSDAPRDLIRRSGAAGASVSSDGAFVAFYVLDPESQRDLWAVAKDEPDEPFALLRTPANELNPRLSPDGKLVAYQSDASGRWEVYLQPFPRGEGRWQVSAGGGEHPMWNPKGGELFYVSGEALVAVKVAAGAEVRVGPEQPLFAGEAVGTRLTAPAIVERSYGVAPDGRRFVVVRGRGMGTSAVVLTDGAWTRASVFSRP